MKISIIFPQPLTSRYVKTFCSNILTESRKVASQETEIEVLALDDGFETIENKYDSEFNEPWVIKKSEEAVKNGTDAIVIGYTFDGGLQAIREAVTVPVIGPTQVSFSVASVLSNRFSVITLSKPLANNFRKLAKEYDVQDKIASIRVVNQHIPDLISASSKVAELVRQESRAAITDDHAEAIVLGGTGLLGISSFLSAELGVPVIDTILLSVKYAEMLVVLGLSHSKLSFSKY